MKDWTIMVYMAGDNNLSENMVYALDEIDKFRSKLPKKDRDKINMLAFFDGSSTTAPTYYIDYTPEKTLFHEIGKKDLDSKDKGNTAQDGKNAASPHSLINFVNWCVNTRKCKAENYAFIMSGHSSGFYGNSMMVDSGSNSHLTIFDLRWALEKIKKKYLGDKKIAILGFDSCLMSMLEIGYELKDVAKTIVASEGNLPNAGWGYVPMFEKLIKTLAAHSCEKMEKSSLSVKSAAKSLVEGFIEQQKNYAIGGRSVDLAAWDLDAVEAVVKALKKLADLLIEKLNLPKLVKENKLTREDVFVYEELKKVILQSHITSQTFMYNQCVDLKDFCEQLALECNCLEEHLSLMGVKSKAFKDITKKAGDVVKAIGKCVLKSGFCGDEYQFSNGISLYFPWTGQVYVTAQNNYRHLNFVRGINSLQTEVAGLEKEKKETAEKGLGKSWNDFLFYYLFIVTMRRTRNNSEDFTTHFNNIVDSPLSKDNWILRTRDNWILRTRDNWTLGTRDNWILRTRDNWILRTRDNWILRTRGEMSAMSAFSSQFRNYQLDWEISGFSDARDYDEDKLKCKYLALLDEKDGKKKT